MSYERYLHDPVPRNVSKFPIHQTYLTSDAERTGKNGYKFKVPEVWDSARSGKKSIAIRSIQWNSKTFLLEFRISIINTEESTTDVFKFSAVIPERTPLTDITNIIIEKFNNWVSDKGKDYELQIEYEFNTLKMKVIRDNLNDTVTNFSFAILHISSSTKVPESLNILLNQPLNYNEYHTPKEEHIFNNVWDRVSPLHFHASFIPFDNYQYLGALFEKWYTPIIYQDTNTSPLFNIWITTDLKNEFPIFHEEFIIRITFIISSESQYSS